MWNSHQWPVVAPRASNQTNSLEYVLFRKELPQVWIDRVDFFRMYCDGAAIENTSHMLTLK